MQFSDLVFDWPLERIFPLDPSLSRNPRQSPYLHQRINPEPVSAPKLRIWNQLLADEFNIDGPNEASLQMLAGNTTSSRGSMFATNYAGHQFGSFAGQLGDGRAMFWGALPNWQSQLWELQLKGCGRTAFSRGADGRAVLRSSLREYVAAEAMYYLGIPTTRSLALVESGDQVIRDLLYSGDPQPEPGAIVTRVAPSFLRFGHFELLAAQGNHDGLKALIQFAIDHFFDEFVDGTIHSWTAWFNHVAKSTLDLVVDWLRVGFTHGVMNTDNMSILGLTIDYGPFGFVDEYDVNFTPNTTDLPGRRYCFGRQGQVAIWNLHRLGEAIACVHPEPNDLLEILEALPTYFHTQYTKMMCRKLGLAPEANTAPEVVRLVRSTEALMMAAQFDMTLFYRNLPNWIAELELSIDPSKAGPPTANRQFLERIKTMASYKDEWHDQLEGQLIQYLTDLSQHWLSNNKSAQAAAAGMNMVNPAFVPRNYQLFEAIRSAESGNWTPADKLLLRLKSPYIIQENDSERWLQKRPDWAQSTPGSSQLSCSS